MLTRTGRCLSLLVTDVSGGQEIVIGRFDFPVYTAPKRVMGVDLNGTSREVLGYPASTMSVNLPVELQAIVDAQHEWLKTRNELFTRDWVVNSLVPGIRQAGYGANGPHDVALSMRDAWGRREPLADGLRRIGVEPANASRGHSL